MSSIDNQSSMNSSFSNTVMEMKLLFKLNTFILSTNSEIQIAGGKAKHDCSYKNGEMILRFFSFKITIVSIYSLNTQ